MEEMPKRGDKKIAVKAFFFLEKGCVTVLDL